jgi:flavin reductase (DIM6/NTAB) family NADH-FMN oxidoreductase RutF
VPVATDDLKEALARRATGVSIVTSRDGEHIHGMTVTAFAEVSLEPPLVLVCADKTSNTHPLIAAGRVFAVNVLARSQESLSNRFASKKDEDRRFEGVEYETGPTGAPLLSGAIAHLDCRVVAAHDAGDHVIYVGEVREVRCAEGEPLLYYRSRYGGFGKSGR